MTLPSCVGSDGRFVCGVHRPAFGVRSQRAGVHPLELGRDEEGQRLGNAANFPCGDLPVAPGEPVYEIPNPLPFLGTTYITAGWAEAAASTPEHFRLPSPPAVSLTALLDRWRLLPPGDDPAGLLAELPAPLLLALATVSTDPADLVALARLACCLEINAASGRPVGLRYRRTPRGLRPVIHSHDLFEAVANNPHLPDDYKRAMVLNPGAQGANEIVGDWTDQEGRTLAFEYLRRNSYIPWGHFASNMAHEVVRYRVAALSAAEFGGLRHLYYQRTCLRLAAALALPLPPAGRQLAPFELEALRRAVLAALAEPTAADTLPFAASLWGWNYGFDFAPSGYRLHASHQQIHQQFALVPARMAAADGQDDLTPYAYGDQLAAVCRRFRAETGQSFAACYLAAIRANRRLDGRNDRPASLVVWEEDGVLLFVPKAQTSGWELQVMCGGGVGNILEADQACRAALDRALYLAMRILDRLGARMVTGVELGKRFVGGEADQPLLYRLLPRLPQSPGAFSETQLRFIVGHFPEDFAAACRQQLADLSLA
ncbi:MAG: hypothetical protein AB1634_04220 [Thermodesulfobacteriota bacterium]